MTRALMMPPLNVIGIPGQKNVKPHSYGQEIERSGSRMSFGNGLAGGESRDPFEPIPDTRRFEIPPAALELLSDLARIPAHYRPTFANSIVELFAKAYRWHRMANRSVEMDASSKELNRVAREARKLKKSIDKLVARVIQNEDIAASA